MSRPSTAVMSTAICGTTLAVAALLSTPGTARASEEQLLYSNNCDSATGFAGVWPRVAFSDGHFTATNTSDYEPDVAAGGFHAMAETPNWMNDGFVNDGTSIETVARFRMNLLDDGPYDVETTFYQEIERGPLGTKPVFLVSFNEKTGNVKVHFVRDPATENDDTFVTVGTLPKNQWLDMRVYVKWTNQESGYVKVVNGSQWLTQANGRTVWYGGKDVYGSFGAYSYPSRSYYGGRTVSKANLTAPWKSRISMDSYSLSKVIKY